MALAYWLARRCGARTVRTGKRVRCFLAREHHGDHEGWVGFSVLVRWR